MKKDEKMYHLLSEVRRACHILWESDDPKALEAWHILFDAHNDALLTPHPKENDINSIMELVETKKQVEKSDKKSIMYV